MRLNVYVNKMTQFGPFAAIIKGKTPFYSVDGSKGGLSTKQDSGSTRCECVTH